MKTLYVGIMMITFNIVLSSVAGIRLTLPPSDNSPDIQVTGPTQVESNADLILNYIKILNDYLWIAMIVVAFAIVVWTGFQLITTPAGSIKGKEILQKGIFSLGAGLAIVLFSYTIVRLVINLL